MFLSPILASTAVALASLKPSAGDVHSTYDIRPCCTGDDGEEQGNVSLGNRFARGTQPVCSLPRSFQPMTQITDKGTVYLQSETVALTLGLSLIRARTAKALERFDRFLVVDCVCSRARNTRTRLLLKALLELCTFASTASTRAFYLASASAVHRFMSASPASKCCASLVSMKFRVLAQDAWSSR